MSRDGRAQLSAFLKVRMPPMTEMRGRAPRRARPARRLELKQWITPVKAPLPPSPPPAGRTVSSSASRVWTISGRPVARAAAIWARKLVVLPVARAVVVEIVEAGLADADDLGMRAPARSAGRGVVLPLLCRPRADGRRPSTRHRRSALGDRAHPVELVERACADGQHARRRPPSRARASTPASSSARPGKVEMAVAVDSIMPPCGLRRSAGRRPAARAARVPGCSAAPAEAAKRAPVRAARRAGRGAWPTRSGMNGWVRTRQMAQRLGQHPEHGGHARRIGLAQRPGRLGVDIAVGVAA